MMHTNSYVGKELGNYRVVTKIASGGFASVFKGQHLILSERIVAIKVLHTYLNLKEEADQFLQEAQLLERLRHPSILSILDVGLNEGFPYLITEYAINGSLRDRLNRQAPGLLSPQESLTILTQIGKALHHAHQHNIVHRDLKPENILFNAQSEALLADFGIATVLSTLHKSNATIIGTPAYMAPEQFEGTISRESDQYALGCIAYELLTGQKPFVAPNFAAFMFKHFTEIPIAPTRLNLQIPLHVEQAILKAMAKKLGDRHPDIAAFIAALYGANMPQTILPAGNVSISAQPTRQPSHSQQNLYTGPMSGKAASGMSSDVPPYITRAIATLDSFNESERYDAIKLLDDSDHPAALVALVQALENPISHVRDLANDKLSWTKKRHPAAQEALVKMLENPKLSLTAARFLRDYHDLRALPILVETLGNEEGRYLEFFFPSNRWFNMEEIQFLLQAMSDERKNIRCGATIALAKHLYEYFKHVRDGKVENIEEVITIVPALFKALQNGEVQPDYIVPALVRVAQVFLRGLQNSDEGTRRNSVWVLSNLLPSLPSDLERWDGLEFVDVDKSASSYSTPCLFESALPIVRKARKDRDQYVRNVAIQTYDQIKKKKIKHVKNINESYGYKRDSYNYKGL